MEERIKIKSIWKSNDPEKLIVFRAGSLEDEIRFYFNDEQYVVAKDNNDGTLSVKYEEVQKPQNVEQNNDNILTYIRKNLKDTTFLKFLFFAIGIVSLISILITILTIILSVVIRNNLLYLLLVNFMFFFIQIVILVIHECKITSLLKSEHSAEHMMVNFLEKNKRLPKNMKELKESSRFSVNCSSQKKIRNATEDFVQSNITIIISFSIMYLLTRNCKNEILSFIIFLVIYFATNYGIWNLIHKYNKLNSIINPILNMLNYIVQCSNTTKKVKDNDLQLAYYAAKYWLQVVYPEFYDEDGDIFNDSEKS